MLNNNWEIANAAAETMLIILEAEYQEGQIDLDAKMRRLRDLSAYSLTHAEILTQREGPELLALGRFFGMSSNSQHQSNQERLYLLSSESHFYQGQSENIEQEVKARKRTTKHNKP